MKVVVAVDEDKEVDKQMKRGLEEGFIIHRRSSSSSRPNNLTHCNALARKAMELLLQTVKSVLDSLVVVVDKDEEVVDLLRVEVTENKD